MDENDPAFLLSEAQKCRRLAGSLSDEEARRTLNKMASALETKAKSIEQQQMQAAAPSEPKGLPKFDPLFKSSAAFEFEVLPVPGS